MKLSKQELDAVIAASPRTFVPFNKLVISPIHQVRQEEPAGSMPIGELAASIEAAGLLHNLVVVRGARGLHETQHRGGAGSMPAGSRRTVREGKGLEPRRRRSPR